MIEYGNDTSSIARREYINKLLQTVPDYIQKVQCDTTAKTKPFSCAVTTCKNCFICYDANSTIKYHKFPSESDVILLEKWQKACGLSKSEILSEYMVCSDHFTLDDYIRNYKEEFTNPNFKRRLKPDALPNKLLPQEDINEVVEIKTEIEESPSESHSILRSENLMRKLKKPESYSLSDSIKAVVDENVMLEKKYIKVTRDNTEYQIKLQRLNKMLRTKHLECRRAELHYLERNKRRVGTDILRKVFSSAQIKKLQGKKRVYWSHDDLAMAFSLRHIGGRECYLYLKNTLNLPLPALSCVQKWASS